MKAPQSKSSFRIIDGGGRRATERLDSRQAVIRVLVGAGADLLLRRISPQRAGDIQRRVEEILALFDRVDDAPSLMPVLQERLDDLEGLLQETRISGRSGVRH